MVGAILLLLLVSTAYVAAQVQVAPAVQADTETRHARQLSADAQRLQSDLIKVAATGQRQAHTLRMGSQYPFRLLLLHPPDPSSTLFNRDDLAVHVRNARAVDDETADFLDGGTLTYQSTSLNLEPQYFEFEAAPTLRLEHGTLYAAYPDHRELSTHIGLVDGRRINLVAVQADVHVSTSRPLTVHQVPLSASARTVQVEDAGDPIEVRLQTDQSLAMWRDVLGSELGGRPADGRYVESLSMDRSTDPNTLVVRLVRGERYRLNLAKVGIRRGGETDFSPSDVPEAAYVTSVSNTNPVVGEQQSTLLSVQVRDALHNPAPPTELEVDPGAGRVDGGATRVSDSRGFVTVRYTAPEIADSIEAVPAATDTVTVSVAGERGDRWTVEFDVVVQNTHGSDGERD